MKNGFNVFLFVSVLIKIVFLKLVPIVLFKVFLTPVAAVKIGAPLQQFVYAPRGGNKSLWPALPLHGCQNEGQKGDWPRINLVEFGGLR